MKRAFQYLRSGSLTVLLVLMSPCNLGLAENLQLPQSVPAPEVFSVPAGNIAPARTGDAPLPETRPEIGLAPATERSPVPIPTESPLSGTEPVAGEGDAGKGAITTIPAPTLGGPTVPPEGAVDAPSPKAMQPDARSTTVPLSPIPQEERICREDLRARGVDFTDRPAETSADGCSLPYPILVKSLGKTTSLEPGALINCATAQTIARFTTDTISPALMASYGQGLKSVSQASAYVCRPRAGTTKLSEHAFGNAIDIARFTLDDGTSIDVEPAPDQKAAKFLAAIRAAACGPFKTVLGPGSDADHALHFHFDLAPRKNGGTFCQ